MSVGSIKRQLNGFQLDLQRCITACNALIQKLNGVTDGRCNTVAPVVSALKREIDKQGNTLRTLSLHCHKELHIFFKEYNAALTHLTKSNKNIKSYLNEIETVAKDIYNHYLQTVAMEGFLKYEITSVDLKTFNHFIVEYKNELIKMQLATKVSNQELIQKAR